MISVEVEGISEEQMREVLIQLPDLWDQKRGILIPTLDPILRNFGETNDFVFGVHAFRLGDNCVIIVLSEYHRGRDIATFSINATLLSGWGAPRTATKAEQKLCELIEMMSGEEWSGFIHSPRLEGTFICPKCNARYSLRTTRQVTDGRFECQNCGALVNPFQGTKSDEDEGVVVCPNCDGVFLTKMLRKIKDGRIECLDCNYLFEP
ncbi:MAG: hypothetical protein ACFFDM_10140 [Candidatus Thorarchaeota archaeon]